jgi:hypothetical protein
MITEESERERLKNLRRSIEQHMEDAASFFMQLPREEHDYYIVNCIGAWQLGSPEPMTSDQLQNMVVRLFEEDTVKPICQEEDERS